MCGLKLSKSSSIGGFWEGLWNTIEKEEEAFSCVWLVIVE